MLSVYVIYNPTTNVKMKWNVLRAGAIAFNFQNLQLSLSESDLKIFQDMTEQGETSRKVGDKIPFTFIYSIECVTLHGLELVVTTRGSDYHVCPRDQEGIWSAGKTYDDAIGDWFRTHAWRLGLKISYKGKMIH